MTTYARKSPEGRARQRALARARHKAHPERTNAHAHVHYAVKTGKLIRPDICDTHDESCKGRIQAHHEDYSKPLEVVWLCQSHHWRLHHPQGKTHR